MDVRHHPIDLNENIDAQLCCPVTGETIVDPVTTITGHTYERSAIETWFETHNTCPNTGIVLDNKTLFPNVALKKIIQNIETNGADYLSVIAKVALIRDPVIIETGETYERAEIEAWLATNNTCPNSGMFVKNKSIFIPNYALKGLIDIYTEMQKELGPSKMKKAKGKLKDEGESVCYQILEGDIVYISNAGLNERTYNSILLAKIRLLEIRIKMIEKFSLKYDLHITGKYFLKITACKEKIANLCRLISARIAHDLENKIFFVQAEIQNLIKVILFTEHFNKKLQENVLAYFSLIDSYSKYLSYGTADEIEEALNMIENFAETFLDPSPSEDPVSQKLNSDKNHDEHDSERQLILLKIEINVRLMLWQLLLLKEFMCIATATEKKEINKIPFMTNIILSNLNEINILNYGRYNQNCDFIQEKISKLFYQLVNRSAFGAIAKQSLTSIFLEIVTLKNKIENADKRSMCVDRNILALAKIQELLNAIQRNKLSLYQSKNALMFKLVSQRNTISNLGEANQNGSRKRKV